MKIFMCDYQIWFPLNIFVRIQNFQRDFESLIHSDFAIIYNFTYEKKEKKMHNILKYSSTIDASKE